MFVGVFLMGMCVISVSVAITVVVTYFRASASVM